MNAATESLVGNPFASLGACGGGVKGVSGEHCGLRFYGENGGWCGVSKWWCKGRRGRFYGEL